MHPAVLEPYLHYFPEVTLKKCLFFIHASLHFSQIVRKELLIGKHITEKKCVFVFLIPFSSVLFLVRCAYCATRHMTVPQCMQRIEFQPQKKHLWTL